jgi:hypothetical protein
LMQQAQVNLPAARAAQKAAEAASKQQLASVPGAEAARDVANARVMELLWANHHAAQAAKAARSVLAAARAAAAAVMGDDDDRGGTHRGTGGSKGTGAEGVAAASPLAVTMTSSGCASPAARSLAAAGEPASAAAAGTKQQMGSQRVLVDIPLNIPSAAAIAVAAAAATQQPQKGQHKKRPLGLAGQVSSSTPSTLAPAPKAACSERRSRRQGPKRFFGEEFVSC